jgi:hypothetical protein
LKDMTEGKARNPQAFYRVANQFGFTFNWGYVSRRRDRVSSRRGRAARRARGSTGASRRSATGDYGVARLPAPAAAPHDEGGPDGLLMNWNNRSARGFMHGDDGALRLGPARRALRQVAAKAKIEKRRGIMNRAATEDVRSPVWPIISPRVGPRPARPRTPRCARRPDSSTTGSPRDAPRVDADNDGRWDDAGPVILDNLWQRLADAVMSPVFGSLLGDLDDVRGLGGQSGHSYVDRDLRTLLGDPVRGRFHLRYCGNGSLTACRASLWQRSTRAAADLAAMLGPDRRPGVARRRGREFTRADPGHVPATNRPTFQQVLEFHAPVVGAGDGRARRRPAAPPPGICWPRAGAPATVPTGGGGRARPLSSRRRPTIEGRRRSACSTSLRSASTGPQGRCGWPTTTSACCAGAQDWGRDEPEISAFLALTAGSRSPGCLGSSRECRVVLGHAGLGRGDRRWRALPARRGCGPRRSAQRRGGSSVIAPTRVIGVLEFVSRSRRRPRRTLMDLLGVVGGRSASTSGAGRRSGGCRGPGARSGRGGDRTPRWDGIARSRARAS